MRLLGLESRSTLRAWKRGVVKAIPRDALERVSYVLGIFKALQVILPQDAAADAWVRKPNAAPLFNGRSALDRMLAGNVGDLVLDNIWTCSWASRTQVSGLDLTWRRQSSERRPFCR